MNINIYNKFKSIINLDNQDLFNINFYNIFNYKANLLKFERNIYIILYLFL